MSILGSASSLTAVLLIVAGVLGYLYSQPDIELMEGGLGTVGRFLSPNIQEKYETLKMINTASIVLIILGGLSFSVGIVGSGSKSKTISKGNGIEEIKELAELKEKGIITDDEFETKKKNLLDKI